MSNSIWKTDNLQEADTRKRILFYAGGSSFPYLGWHYPNKGFSTWDYEDVQKWAYLSDVLAQADKVERLQKAVDLLSKYLQLYMDDYANEFDADGIYNDEIERQKRIWNEIKQLTKE